MDLSILDVSNEWNYPYGAFCVWLLWFNVIFKGSSMLCLLWISTSFLLWLIDTLFYWYTTLYQCINGHRLFPHFKSLYIMLLWTFTDKSCEIVYFISCWICLEVELLGHVVNMFNFWGTVKWFSKSAAPHFASYQQCMRFQIFSVSLPILVIILLFVLLPS